MYSYKFSLSPSIYSRYDPAPIKMTSEQEREEAERQRKRREKNKKKEAKRKAKKREERERENDKVLEIEDGTDRGEEAKEGESEGDISIDEEKMDKVSLH